MKTRTWLVGLFCATAVALSAKAAEGYLLKADSLQGNAGELVARGNAQAVSGELRVTAKEIVYDEALKTMRFAGDITIHLGGRSISVKELTLDVAGQRVFKLASGNISILPPGSSATESSGSFTGGQYVPLFQTKPKNDTAAAGSLLTPSPKR